MAVDFEPDKPIYQQIMDRISSEIVRGKRKPGEKLPSVREYAMECGVNPNTMSRTYRELEQIGVVETKRGQGTFVTENVERLTAIRESLKEKHIASFIQDMFELGFSLDEMIDGIKDFDTKEEK